MKIPAPAGVLLALVFAAAPVRAGDDAGLARLAICQDSWLDWSKSDTAKAKAFADRFRAGFTPHDNDPYYLPKAEVSVAGLRIVQAYPDSVGMGVGFSLLVSAPFDKARAIFAKALGKPLTECDASEGMKSCELQIAEKRTFMLMAEDSPKSTTTLVGCYYYYEK